MAARGGSGTGRFLLGSCLAAIAALCSPAMAQTGGAAPAPTEESHGLGEVVVTARYVRENIQETPIAITAQTAEQLEAANITNISTLGAVVPNLWTVPGDTQSAGTPKIRMRGVIQGDSSSLAVPPAVAIYTDDVYHSTTAGSELDFIDIARVEVNRGPQSTLSGNASIGGAIKLYSVDPEGDGSGYVTLTGGSRNKQGASGAFDMALSDTWALRVSGNYESQDGYVDRLDFACEMNRAGTPALAGRLPANPTVDNESCVVNHLGGGTRMVTQAKLRWRPDPSIDLMFTARHRNEDLEETPEIAKAYQPNPNPNANTLFQAWNNLTQAAYGIQVDSRFLAPARTGGYATYATNCRPQYAFQYSGFCYPQGKTADHTLLSARLNYEIAENVHMTAIAAYTEYENEFTQNGDQSPLGYVLAHFHNRNYQHTGEVRFDGTLFDDKLDWVVGAFMLRLDGHQDNFIGVFTTTQDSKVTAENESQSAFFHLDYDLTDRWRISGGARYTDGQIAITIDNPLAVSVLDPAISSETRWDWLVSSDYRITDDMLVYVSAATGSRPAGLTTIVNTPRQLGPTPAEELISYELGLKSEWFDQRLRSNIAGFFTDYEKVSTAVTGFECVGEPGTVPTLFPNRSDCLRFANSGVLNYTINVGIPAEVVGFEWDITAIPIDGLRLDWTGGYNHYVSGIKTPGQPGYVTPGNHRQPLWNMHANASYDIETSWGTFTPRIDWNWQSQQDFDLQANIRAPLPILIIDAYSIWNAQIGYESENGDWSATLQMTNLEDKFYHYQVFSGTINAQTRVAPPREFSLTVRRSF